MFMRYETLNVKLLTPYQVLVDEAIPFVIAIWRQIIFESVAYGEALETGSILVD